MRRLTLAAVVVVALTAATADALCQEPHRPPLLRGLDLYLPIPHDNALTRNKAALGRRLFFDPVLSGDGTLSCASCHDPDRAFTDGRALSVGSGGRTTARSAPTLLNRAYGETQFWDGRAASLERQSLAPIENPDELGSSVEAVVRRLRNDHDYRARFLAALGREPDPDALAAALASYVRTILAGDSPFDRYGDGDTAALTDEQRAGLRVFRGKARCTNCHLGPRLSDEQFHNTGVAWRKGVPGDSGRFAVTREPRHIGAFKTPTLREITRTAPYMHDGSLATLAEVIAFYERGGHPNPHLDPEIRPLRLTSNERSALLRFLEALSGTVREGW